MAIIRVQGNKRSPAIGTPLTSLSLTLDSTPTEGNVLILVFGDFNMSNSLLNTITSISQTGVTWTQQAYIHDSNYCGKAVEIWAGIVGSGSSASLTVSLAGVVGWNGGIVDVCEYSGLETSGVLDKTASNTGNSANPDTGTTSTITQSDELWIGGTCIGAITSSLVQSSPTNGFTLLDGAGLNVAGYQMSLAYLEKIVSATGTANSGTTAANSSYWAGCIATFKAAASATLREVTDSIGFSDVALRNKTFTIADSVGTADSVLGNKTLRVSETVSLAEIVQVGAGGVKKTRLFLIMGDLAIQLTGD